MGRSMPRSAKTRGNSSACAAAVQAVPRGRSLCPNPGLSMAMAKGVIRGGCENAADQHVLDHHAVAVQKHDRSALSKFHYDGVDARPDGIDVPKWRC
jgi:hypothetical protein